MILKTFGLLAPLVAGGLYMSGMFTGNYTREVERPPAEVLAALVGLDIPGRSGPPGADPVFLIDRQSDRVTWTVMSGDKVAIRMVAVVEPAAGGRHSRVTAFVERGDAPDDFVSPAFRSTGIALALFGMALEGELAGLTAPGAADRAKCRALTAELLTEIMAVGPSVEPQYRPRDLGQATEGVSRLDSMEAELRRNGCDASSAGSAGFTHREGAFEDPGAEAAGTPVEGVTLVPGQPMIDPNAR